VGRWKKQKKINKMDEEHKTQNKLLLERLKMEMDKLNESLMLLDIVINCNTLRYRNIKKKSSKQIIQKNIKEYKEKIKEISIFMQRIKETITILENNLLSRDIVKLYNNLLQEIKIYNQKLLDQLSKPPPTSL
jgi:hypothetical protein